MCVCVCVRVCGGAHGGKMNRCILNNSWSIEGTKMLVAQNCRALIIKWYAMTALFLNVQGIGLIAHIDLPVAPFTNMV